MESGRARPCRPTAEARRGRFPASYEGSIPFARSIQFNNLAYKHILKRVLPVVWTTLGPRSSLVAIPARRPLRLVLALLSRAANWIVLDVNSPGVGATLDRAERVVRAINEKIGRLSRGPH